MKKSLLLIAVMLLSFAAATAQSCLPEGITFNTQEQIDNFQANYPGCTEIEGDVTIQGNDITNLNGLSVLTSIGGNLNFGIFLHGNNSLTDLSGLGNLTFIGGSLNIGSFLSGNNSLSELTGLENLTSVGGNIHIRNNPSLTNLTGFEGLVSIGGYLWIEKNHALLNLNGMNNLTSIGGRLLIGYMGSGNSSLSSLAGLDNLTLIGESLVIETNPSLSTCDDEWLCNILASISGDVTIRYNKPGCNSVIEAAYNCGGIPCLQNGNYVFNMQNDIDIFSLAFPGCSEVNNVLINRNSSTPNDISNLDGLIPLTSITGDLRILNNTSLNNLAGLNNLTFIGGSLEISMNFALTNCSADWLCSLVANTGGAVEVSYNGSGCQSVIDIGFACGGIPCLNHGNYDFYSQNDLNNFPMAFPGCIELTGSVTVIGNSINNLIGLSAISSIENNFTIGTGTSLSNLNGLENLTNIGGELRIWGNNSLVDLNGLDNLTFVAGDLSIGASTNLYAYGNPSLNSLIGLESLDSVGGNLRILLNHALTSLAGFENVAFIGGDLRISSNNSISDLSALQKLVSPLNELIVYRNPSLTSLTGLEGLPSVIGDVSIVENSSLNSMTGLNNLSSIGGNLWIANDSLTSLTGLESLASVGGDMFLGDGGNPGNPSLINMTGLENLTTVGGHFSIGQSTRLLSINGLERLNSVNGNFSVVKNPLLASLEGLENLTSVNGNLAIWQNSSLSSLAGLDSIAAGSIANLNISNNTSLSTCEVKSICDYLAAPNGTVTISDNAPGCNSPEEVVEACESSSIEVIPVEDGFTVFPNPFTNHLSIELSLDKHNRVAVAVYNNMGQLVAKPAEKELHPGVNQLQWDSSGLPSGIYLLRLQVGQEIVTQKIIKY